MIVQVSGLTHPETVNACLAANVDHLGVVIGQDDRPGTVSTERASSLLDPVPATQKGVAITSATDVEAVLDIERSVAPDILCVAADRMDLPPADLFDVREGLAEDTELMRSITVEGRGVVYPAMALDPLVEWLVLESSPGEDDDDEDASDRPHPWEVCAEIVEELGSPCLLGGDVTTENVEDAIEQVSPAGVALSVDADAESIFDAASVEAFVGNARGVTAE